MPKQPFLARNFRKGNQTDESEPYGRNWCPVSYTDMLDRFDEHAKSIHRMSIGVLPAAPALNALSIELASTMLLREQQLKSILTALRSSGVPANTAIADAGGTGTPTKTPHTAQDKRPVESRKEKREREAAERKAKKAAAEAEAKKTPKGPGLLTADQNRAWCGHWCRRRWRGDSERGVLQFYARRVQPRSEMPLQS